MIALYVRVSTEDQLKGYSIDGQIEECKRLAGNEEFLEYVDDGYTGEIMNRPALMKLQEDIENGLINKVICYDPDRLSRKLLNQLVLTQLFQKHGVELQFVRHDYKDDAEGQLFFQVRGAFSEFDKAKIKHNTMTGRYRKAKKGLVVKNSQLYGYSYDKANNVYTINKEEAKVVKMIFDYYTNPSSPFRGINGIALHLTDMGIPTKKGGKTWHRQVVRQLLMNEAYTGTYIQNRYDTVGDYVRKQSGEKVEVRIRPEEEWIYTQIPMIIEKEQFDYAQKLLENGRRRSANRGRHNYLLSGMVRCGRCGGTMTGKRTLSHGKDFFIYNCRRNYAGAKDKGCGRQMSENKLNLFVWEQIIEYLDNPEKMKELEPEKTIDFQADTLKHLEQEIERTKKGRKRLFQLISLGEDDDFDLEEVKEQIRSLQIKERDLQEQYNQLSEEIKDDSNEPNVLALEQAVEMYKSKKTEFTFEEKQELLRILIDEIIIIDPETIHIKLL